MDLSENGRQPMITEDGDLAIVFNGEIFNFQSLKFELCRRGCKFKSKTDTEVLLYGYKKFGRKILDKLDGQFVFCIYDKKKNEFFLARDRLGVNPLYYYFDGEKFIFGSELKVILEAGIKKEIDRFALNYYFMYGYTPRERSIIKNCFKLLPAHYLVFSLDKKNIERKERYWNFEFVDEIKDETEAKKLILKQLEKSVRSRMVADVPVGAFLSGGVDSSAVVAMMSRYTKNLNTFSVKFDHDEFDESKYAKIVSEKFNTRHHEVEFSARDIRDLILKLPYHYDEPFADPSMIPTFLVSGVAKKYVTVSLSGDGGDELFGGYPSYLIYKKASWLKFVPGFLISFALFVVNGLKTDKLIKLKKFLRLGLLDGKIKYAEFRNFLYREEFKKMINENPEKYYKEYVKGNFVNRDYLTEATNIDLRNYLPENCLVKVDRASLGNGLESRPPFLDHKMAELAAKISPKLKIKGRETKYIFKKAMEGILPKEIIYRRKQGFGVPLKYYLRNELRDLVEKYVINYNKHNFYRREIIGEIKKIIEMKDWPKDYSRLIWAIMMFNLWYDRWMLSKK